MSRATYDAMADIIERHFEVENPDFVVFELCFNANLALHEAIEALEDHAPVENIAGPLQLAQGGFAHIEQQILANGLASSRTLQAYVTSRRALCEELVKAMGAAT